MVNFMNARGQLLLEAHIRSLDPAMPTSLEPAAPLAAAARARARRSDLRLSTRDRLGSSPGRGRDWLLPLDRVEGAQAGRALAPSVSRQRAGQPVRVALPRRPAAHGHEPLRPLPAARPPRHG